MPWPTGCIGREEEARDVAQETFLRAFRALERLQGPGEVLVLAVSHHAESLPRLDSARAPHARSCRRRKASTSIELAGEAVGAESVDDLVSRKELGRAVAKAMALLPEEQRTAIILKEYHGLTFQEIADLLDCPLSTVKTRLYQGLTVLRRQLQRADVESARARTAALDPVIGSTN